MADRLDTTVLTQREHALLEGPRPLGDGRVLFSDVTGGGVYVISLDGGEPDVVVERRRGIGGLVPHAGGGVVVAGRDVAHVGVDGTVTVLLAAPDGVTGFNDLTTLPDGSLLVGALRFKPFGGDDPVPGDLWHIGLDGGARVVADDLLWPNGLGVSPDGATLYASDFAAAEVRSYGLAPDGSLTARGTFAAAPRGACDGLAVDAEGGVWVALGLGAGLAHLRADGSLQRVLDIDAGFVSSLAFAGDALVVTTIGAVLRAPAPAAGLDVPPCARGAPNLKVPGTFI